MKRLVVISDLHCGHWAGLTPPDWWQGGKKGQHQKELWRFYVGCLKEIGKIDFVVCNGDAIDGKGKRSGGSELVTTDRLEQAEMAAHAIDTVKANECGLIYGTSYHTGDLEDFEDSVADKCKTPVGFVSGQEFFKYGDRMFDFKHFVGASSVPHGRHTQIAKEKLWNIIWADRAQQPAADFIIRSHVHYHDGAFDRYYTGMTTPCLQGHGSKFGVRKCSGTIDIGMLVFEFNNDGEYQKWYGLFADLPQQVARVTKR